MITDLNGTSIVTFQVGLGGPKIKSDTGTLQARNSADNAYTTVSAAAPTASDHLATLAYIRDSILPAGTIVVYGGSTAPTGWLLCYGQAVNRVTYATLFTVFGSVYGGGDGVNTFNLPDLRGRFPLGADNMGGSSANRVTAAAADTVGSSSGEESHTQTEAELAAHTHTVTGTSATSGQTGTDTGTPSGSTTTGSTGSSTPMNIMNPYLTINYIVKYY